MPKGKRKYKFGTAVQVCWRDSKSVFGWQYDPEVKRDCAKIKSLGYVVQTNDEGLVLSSSIGDSGASMDDISIPWGSIAQIDKVGESFDR